MIGAGLLLITMAGFAFTGVLVDQIEKFFAENRKEELKTEKTETGELGADRSWKDLDARHGFFISFRVEWGTKRRKTG